jgi:hypothetical protein
MPADPKTILSCSSNIISKKTIDNMIVVVNVETGKDYALNVVASEIFELIDGRRSLGQIAEALSLEFNAPYEQVLEDTLSLANWLLERDLVTM